MGGNICLITLLRFFLIKNKQTPRRERTPKQKQQIEGLLLCFKVDHCQLTVPYVDPRSGNFHIVLVWVVHMRSPISAYEHGFHISIRVSSQSTQHPIILVSSVHQPGGKRRDVVRQLLPVVADAGHLNMRLSTFCSDQSAQGASARDSGCS